MRQVPVLAQAVWQILQIQPQARLAAAVAALVITAAQIHSLMVLLGVPVLIIPPKTALRLVRAAAVAGAHKVHLKSAALVRQDCMVVVALVPAQVAALQHLEPQALKALLS